MRPMTKLLTCLLALAACTDPNPPEILSEEILDLSDCSDGTSGSLAVEVAQMGERGGSLICPLHGRYPATLEVLVAGARGTAELKIYTVWMPNPQLGESSTWQTGSSVHTSEVVFGDRAWAPVTLSAPEGRLEGLDSVVIASSVPVTLADVTLRYGQHPLHP